MAIPYRLGTTDCFDVLRATENPMLCQFLIGKVQRKIFGILTMVNKLCQFLIGKVQLVMGNLTKDPEVRCQFLIGKVQHTCFIGKDKI